MPFGALEIYDASDPSDLRPLNVVVLDAGGKRRKEIDVRERHYSRLLVPGGLITEGRDESRRSAPVESDTIEEFIEE